VATKEPGLGMSAIHRPACSNAAQVATIKRPVRGPTIEEWVNFLFHVHALQSILAIASSMQLLAFVAFNNLYKPCTNASYGPVDWHAAS